MKHILCILGIHWFKLKEKRESCFDLKTIKFSAKLGNYNTKRVTEYDKCKYCNKERVISYNQ